MTPSEQARADAACDAETLRLAWLYFFGWGELHAHLGAYAEAGLPEHDGFQKDEPDWYADMATRAAKNAYLFVPGLRGDR